MKVHLIKKQTIEDFAKNNARSRSSLRLWLAAIAGADWNDPQDILETFGSADLLGNGSNRVGVHAEYSRLCSEKEQYIVSTF